MPAHSSTIAQITDCHLLTDADARLHGRHPDESLARVLDAVRAGSPELLIATGDLTEEGSPRAYRRLKSLLQSVPCPVACLPGNHDDTEAMRRHLLGGNIGMSTSLTIGAWQLFLLDDTVPGRPEGRLGDTRLAALERRLREHRGRRKLVFLHHQPVATESPWIDRMGLADGEQLLDTLAQDGEVASAAFGHIHHAFSTERDGIRLYGTPATSFQARPAREHFELDGESGPGFRWFRLFDDGALDTGVTRVPATGQI